jgi:hypothetical protein
MCSLLLRLIIKEEEAVETDETIHGRELPCMCVQCGEIGASSLE